MATQATLATESRDADEQARNVLHAGCFPDSTLMPYPFSHLSYLVGHSRGGTTWLGKLLACHEELRYIFEPFASQAHPCTGIDTQTVFNGGRFIRQQKRGEPRVDIPTPHFFRESRSPGESDEFAELARRHLTRLAEAYFPEQRDYRLLVKQPRLENLGWAVQAIRPRRVIVLDRHPFGVVNSLARWNVQSWNDIEWQVFVNDTNLSADQRHLAEMTQTIEERIFVLSYLRSQYGRRFCQTHSDARRVEYETLCRSPRTTIVELWEWMGLCADATSLARLDAELAAREPVPGNRLLDTHQDPLLRCDAWRSELPADARKRLEQFVTRMGLDVPLPGAGLSPLTVQERRASERQQWRYLWRRCRVWLRTRVALGSTSSGT